MPEAPHGEPDPEGLPRFVIQEHHASRLHWDLRLERDGVLVSWAVPKGVPPTTAKNSLAVMTEDHPLQYLDFAGEIPRGEYGAGIMTVWDTGTYELEKWRDDEVIATLEGRDDGPLGRVRLALIRTEGQGEKSQWLLHRMKTDAEGKPQSDGAPVVALDHESPALNPSHQGPVDHRRPHRRRPPADARHLRDPGHRPRRRRAVGPRLGGDEVGRHPGTLHLGWTSPAPAFAQRQRPDGGIPS